MTSDDRTNLLVIKAITMRFLVPVQARARNIHPPVWEYSLVPQHQWYYHIKYGATLKQCVHDVTCGTFIPLLTRTGPKNRDWSQPLSSLAAIVLSQITPGSGLGHIQVKRILFH